MDEMEQNDFFFDPSILLILFGYVFEIVVCILSNGLYLFDLMQETSFQIRSRKFIPLPF